MYPNKHYNSHKSSVTIFSSFKPSNITHFTHPPAVLELGLSAHRKGRALAETSSCYISDSDLPRGVMMSSRGETF